MAQTQVETPDEDVFTNAIVQVVADTRGVDPTDIRFCLYEHLDARSLELLYASTSTWEVTLEVDGLDVTIQSGEPVSITAK
jgi:hypothetical protein